MRAVSFMYTSVLFGLAYGTSCNYETLTSEATDAFASDCGSDVDLTACDDADQFMVDAAIATSLYAQCQCVYYDEETAFNYRKGCWQKRNKANGGRCWTAAFKTFYTSGDLETRLNGPDGICSAETTTTLPPPTTTEELPAPVATTTTPNGSNCVDDPKGILAYYPMPCSIFLTLTDGCDGERPAWFNSLFAGETQYTLCPATCNPEGCGLGPVETTEEPQTDLVCEDDPDRILKNKFNTNCGEMVSYIKGCDDPYGIVPLVVKGATAQSLCPASCDSRCN